MMGAAVMAVVPSRREKEVAARAARGVAGLGFDCVAAPDSLFALVYLNPATCHVGDQVISHPEHSRLRRAGTPRWAE